MTATAKIASMITDYKASQRWNEKMQFKDRYGYTLNVLMLTSGNWDIADPKNGHELVPPELLPSVMVYE